MPPPDAWAQTPDEWMPKAGAAAAGIEVAEAHESHHAEEVEEIKPFIYVKLIVSKPEVFCCAWCGCICLFLFAVIISVAVAGAFAISSGVPLDNWNEASKRREDSWVAAELKNGDPDATQTPQSVPTNALLLIYQGRSEATSGTKSVSAVDIKSVREIFDIENYIMSVDDYADYCYMTNQTLTSGATGFYCAQPISPLAFFFEYDPESHQWLENNDDAALEARAGVIFSSNDTRVTFFVDKYFNAVTNPYTEYTRSQFFYGLPLTNVDSDYKNDYDEGSNRKDQIEETEVWMCKEYFEYLDQDASTDNVKVYYSGTGVADCEATGYMIRDLMLALGSIAFVWGFMWLQTGSLFVTASGMSQILGSFPIAMFLYLYIFQITYFGVFNILAIFIILGIGADDVFVFFDTYRASYFMGGVVTESLVNQLSWTYYKAVGAMFITSLTTFIAFVSTAITPYVAIQTFGIFAALLVLCNFTLVCTFFPCVVVVYHNRWEDLHYKIPDKVKNCAGDKKEAAGKKKRVRRKRVGEEDTLIEMEGGNAKGTDESAGVVAVSEDTAAHADSEIPTEQKPNLMELFFRDHYAVFVTKHSWAVLLFFVLFTIVFLVFATMLVPDPEPVELFPKGTNIRDYKDISGGGSNPDDGVFPRGGDGETATKVFFVWGVKARPNRNNQDRYDMFDTADPRFDDGEQGFQSQLPRDQQQFLLDFCNRTLTDPTIAPLIRNGQINCVFGGFQAWLAAEKGLSFPVDPTLLQDLLAEFVLPENYFYSISYLEEIGLVEGVLKYITIYINTTIDTSVSFSDGEPKYNDFEDYIDAVNANASALGYTSLDKAFQCTIDVWSWMFVQKALFINAFTSIAIGISLAWIILVFATNNPIVASLSVLTIGCIIVCILGVMVMMGWKMGTLEAVASILVVGFSVDYVVHVAHAYIESHWDGRKKKVQDALTEVGVSILSGAFSTLGASAFLFAATVIFLLKFGIFIFFTIFFSLIYTMGFFTSIMASIGPQGSGEEMTGDIGKYKRILSEKIAEKRGK